MISTRVPRLAITVGILSMLMLPAGAQATAVSASTGGGRGIYLVEYQSVSVQPWDPVLGSIPTFAAQGEARFRTLVDRFDTGSLPKMTLGPPPAGTDVERVARVQADGIDAYGYAGFSSAPHYTPLPGGVLSVFTGLEILIDVQAYIYPGDRVSIPDGTSAQAEVRDPFAFAALPGDASLRLAAGLGAGFAVHARGSGARAAMTTHVGTDLPGLETLLEVRIAASGSDTGDPVLTVDVLSHPDLAINDATLETLLLDAFAFDAPTASYVLENDVPFYDGMLPLPGGIPFTLYLDQSVGASPVPLPAALWLMASMLGTLLGVSGGIRRGRFGPPGTALP